jgi:outer membrane biosynthesis protein TonB
MPRRYKLAFALITLVTGCRHAPLAPANTGASSFTVVDARRAPAEGVVIVGDVEPGASKFTQDYRPAAPRKNQPLPIYPARALKAKAGAATVGVRVLVDAEGKPADIGPSILIFSTPGPFADDFLQAVKAALGQWLFHPAEIIQLERIEAPGVSYNRITRSERTEAQLDLAFTFTENGQVASGK